MIDWLLGMKTTGVGFPVGGGEGGREEEERGGNPSVGNQRHWICSGGMGPISARLSPHSELKRIPPETHLHIQDSKRHKKRQQKKMDGNDIQIQSIQWEINSIQFHPHSSLPAGGWPSTRWAGRGHVMPEVSGDAAGWRHKANPTHQRPLERGPNLLPGQPMAINSSLNMNQHSWNIPETGTWTAVTLSRCEFREMWQQWRPAMAAPREE